MNDFTKEELTTIKFWAKFYTDHSPLIEWRNRELTSKIQSMIDNYRDPNCDHVIDKTIKACKLCGLPSHSIPCVGGWL